VNAVFAKAGCADGHCTGINTPGGKPLPYFTKGKHNATANAAADFIRFWTKDEIKEVIFQGSEEDARNIPYNSLTSESAKKEAFLGLATISFIGLGGNGGEFYSGVAGGANQIEEWAKNAHCSTPVWVKTGGTGDWSSPVQPWTEAHFNECSAKFAHALRGDLMWMVTLEIMQHINFINYKVSFGTASIQPKGLLHDQPDPKDPSKQNETDAVKQSDAKDLFELISKSKNFGIGRSGADIEEDMNKLTLQQGVKAVMAVAKAVCTKLGRGFGFGFENTCAKALWMHKFLSLGLSSPEERKYLSTKIDWGDSSSKSPGLKAYKQVASVLGSIKNTGQNLWTDVKGSLKQVPTADFGDADVAKGAAFGFKAKRSLRKRERQQGALQAKVDTDAAALALGKQLMDKISENTVNYMTGAAYAM